LEQKGIVDRSASHWVLTKQGAQAQALNLLPGKRVERRSFWFISELEKDGFPAFIAPANPAAFQSIESSRIKRGSLEALLESTHRDAEWKRSRHFPAEIDSIITPDTASATNDLHAWEKIVVVHPYRLQAAFITYVRESGQPGLAAFAYQEHGWTLSGMPVFDLAASWEQVFPDLPLEPGELMISEAWRKWLTQRGVAASTVERYRLEQRGGRIGVLAIDGTEEVLGGPRGDLARGEAWLVLQEGALRRVMLLEVRVGPTPQGVPQGTPPK
jgi:hypothetical protein